MSETCVCGGKFLPKVTARSATAAECARCNHDLERYCCDKCGSYHSGNPEDIILPRGYKEHVKED